MKVDQSFREKMEWESKPEFEEKWGENINT